MRCWGVIFILLAQTVFAQDSYRDYVSIRNYQYSVHLLISNSANQSFLFDDYGNCTESRSIAFRFTFLYSGQEYSDYLGIYFFPSRTYSPQNKAFQQVDPESQLFSPYSYLEGEPVNSIDKNGKEKKPLILYEENQWFQEGTSWDMADLGNQIGRTNGYFVPLTDFMNGEVGDLSDWNGNVFLDGHLCANADYDLEIEKSPQKELLRTQSKDIKFFRKKDNTEFYGRTNARNVGGHLGRLSLERGIQVENITVGGCQGADVGRRIAEGYRDAMPKRMDGQIWVHGLKEDRYSVVAGELTTSEQKVEGLDETRYYVSRDEADYYGYKKNPSYRGGKKKFIGLYRNNKKGLPEALPYATGQELEDMVREAQIPKNLQGHFDSFPMEY